MLLQNKERRIFFLTTRRLRLAGFFCFIRGKKGAKMS
nr:MAG TPA: hypothetical protein [Caudoviricetes sp.]